MASGGADWTVACATAGHTRDLGVALGRAAEAVGGGTVALSGPLGAGKTCLAQGVGEGLGLEELVVSPTFVIVAEYEAPLPLLHADAYRLEPGEERDIGLEELLEDWPGLALVEWAGKVPEALPLDRLEVHLAVVGDGRRVSVRATGPRSARLLAAWRGAS